MSLELSCQPMTSDLAADLESTIVKRTWGAVRELRVEIDGDRVLVHGRCRSYYQKQLVVQAVMEKVGSSQVDLDIAVV